jgi:hypothetical protein
MLTIILAWQLLSSLVRYWEKEKRGEGKEEEGEGRRKREEKNLSKM